MAVTPGGISRVTAIIARTSGVYLRSLFGFADLTT